MRDIHELIAARTLDHLEWPRLQAAWLARAKGASARRASVPCCNSLEATRTLLTQTREASQLLTAGDPLPLEDLRAVDAHLDRLEREGSLDGPALADLLITLRNAERIRRFLGARKASAPALHDATPIDPSLDDLLSVLSAALDDHGLLHDSASDELARLRAEQNVLRERVLARLQDVIDRHGDLLSDRYYTLREGRYVVPVRSDAHDRLPGIVHGSSASGASIFVEPRAVVAHGNRLKMAEAEREREELRILAALSERAREELPALREAAAALDRLDLRHAAALLGRDYAGHVPELSAEPLAQLHAARHPLLALDGVQVVPNEIEISAGHGLVISGPNAGGKTVVLKTLGLCALMARCGLPLPAADGSTLGYFDTVWSDLGDEQSTATNLSTFSAHVKNLVTILTHANDRSLVLLDEVATGTDPGEGAALACAVVDGLCQRGAALVVTTHYEALKALSLRDPRLRSASVGLDAERMEPTFRLLLDIPGASSALLVARRFGMPAEIVDAAEQLLPNSSRDFEALVRRLTDTAQALQSEREGLISERAALAVERRDYEHRASQLREQSKHRLSKEAEQLMTELRQARSELDQARKLVRRDERQAQDLKRDVKNAEQQLSDVAARVGAGSPLSAALQAAQGNEQAPAAVSGKLVALTEPSVGDRVYVAKLRAEAIVSAVQKGKLLVTVGAMKLWIELAEARPSTAAKPEAAPIKLMPQANLSAERMPDNTVDVRGLRADDALSMLDSFIDRLYSTTGRVGYVVHGHGSGALRQAIREHLKTVPYITESRPANASEGGDSVTAFFLS